MRNKSPSHIIIQKENFPEERGRRKTKRKIKKTGQASTLSGETGLFINTSSLKDTMKGASHLNKSGPLSEFNRITKFHHLYPEKLPTAFTDEGESPS